MNAGASITRFGEAGLMMSPAPMIIAKPSGPKTLPPRLPTGFATAQKAASP